MSQRVQIIALLFGLVTYTTCMVVISVDNYIIQQPNSTPDCSKGPEYWCSNIASAKSCRAIKHCIQTVWERQTINEDNDNVCNICKEMVQEARDQLMSNETQEELKEVFEGSCALIPIKIIRMECNKVSDEFVPELIEMLASQMNPTMVCSTAGLCNSEWSDKLQLEYQNAQTKSVQPLDVGNMCQQCQNMMDNTIETIQSLTKDNVLNLILNACGELSSYSDGCRTLAVTYIDEIYGKIQQKMPHLDACKLVGMCDEINKPMSVGVYPKSNDVKFESMLKTNTKVTGIKDEECDFCQALVKHVRDLLVSNTTEDEFRQVAVSICKQTGTFSAECLSLVDQYYDQIYQFILNELDPKEACRLLTLCPNPGLLKSNGETPLWIYNFKSTLDVLPATKLTPAEKIEIPMAEIEIPFSETETDRLVNGNLIGQDESNAIRNSAPLPEQLYSPISLTVLGPKQPGCIFCEYVLHQVVLELNNATIDKEIEQAVRNVCKKFPSTLSDECTKFVDTYGDAFIYLLGQELDPSRVCPMLKLCPAEENASPNFPSNPFRRPETKDPNACALCEFVITELDHKLQDNKTEQSIKAALENVCQHLPQSIRKDCILFVDSYTEQIVEMLLADFTPEEVCTALKFCTRSVKASMTTRDITVGEFMDKVRSGTAGKQKVAVNKVKTPVTCVMCEFAMTELDKRITTNSTREEIKRAIDFLCAHLPSTVAEQCIDFVEEYGDELYDLLVKEMAPKVICTQLGLCITQSQYKSSVPRLQTSKVAEKVDGMLYGTCDICQIAVEYLDKLLEDDAVEESIDHIIEKVCDVVPSNSQNKCRAIVDTYGPYLLSQLGILADKIKVCQSIHLCQPPAGNVQLLGGKQCTWGPSYWCASTEHASACNALEHCQTKVWMKAEP